MNQVSRLPGEVATTVRHENDPVIARVHSTINKNLVVIKVEYMR